jgi:hypothetical protein
MSDFLIALGGSIGILLFNLVMVPPVGRFWGIKMTVVEAGKMSMTFFVLRVLWIYFLLRIAK